MSLSIKRQTFNPSENQEWLGSAEGTQSMNSITLDAALCLAKFTSGVVPSGTPLGKVTATGRYAPALTAAVDGSQVVEGHLFTTIDLTSGGLATAENTPGSLFWGPGEVIRAKLPVISGVVDLATPANQPKLIKYV